MSDRYAVRIVWAVPQNPYVVGRKIAGDRRIQNNLALFVQTQYRSCDKGFRHAGDADGMRRRERHLSISIGKTNTGSPIEAQ